MFATLSLLAPLFITSVVTPPALQEAPVAGWPELDLGPREIEHLFNRAGFGATEADLALAATMQPADLVEHLATVRRDFERVSPELIRWEDFDLDPSGVPVPPEQSKYKGMKRKDAAKIKSELARTDHRQYMDYVDAYFRSMLAGDAPLHDRMALFWHGFFTTASPVVLRKFELIHQHQFIRENALGNYKDLLHGIVRDPGMLQYLDNNLNVAGHPNENLARELMELYALGEGNYTEVDVREAARALTGAHAGADGLFAFKPENHDAGEKTVLGTTGKLRGEELVNILLAEDSCARWVARRILTYFEGREPSADRLEDYAAYLRSVDYEIKPFMERLLLDPAFYRDEVIGTRVQSPIDYFVGACRKLDLHPASYVPFRMTLELGEGLYHPPNVKGWEGGESWITSNLLMQRGNTLGTLLGTLPEPAPSEGAMQEEELELSMGAEPDLRVVARDALVRELGHLAKLGLWERQLDLLSAFGDRPRMTDAELARAALGQWLAFEPPAYLIDLAVEHLARERDALGLEQTPLLESPEAEALLRRLAHLIYSLPEANLG